MAVDVSASRSVRSDAIESILSQVRQHTARESRKYGKSLRKAVPRDVFASWMPAPTRPDPVELILSQDKARVQELVPVRHERMAQSALAFLRGAALIMASDLSTLPATGIEVQLCGDAHISNFGLFLSPERRTVFDINDFDETARGPWEWDVARLAASIEVCGRNRGFTEKSRRKAVRAAVQGYQDAMARFAEMGHLDVWYAHLDVDDLAQVLAGGLDKRARKAAKKAVTKSKAKTSVRALSKLTEVVDGKLQVVSDPPLVVPLRGLAEGAGLEVPENLDMAKLVALLLSQYRKTLPPERMALVDRYHGVDIAHKVVGVGSVGLQAWIVVMEGKDAGDPLVLQVKEATESVVERFAGKAPQESSGQRVVEGQHAMQTASDSLLGWTSLPMPDGRTRDFYVRQLWDGKGSVDLDAISATGLCRVAEACGWTLAHAHARTGDRFAIAAYLGSSDKFVRALESFARAYADQNEDDYQRFVEATAGE